MRCRVKMALLKLDRIAKTRNRQHFFLEIKVFESFSKCLEDIMHSKQITVTGLNIEGCSNFMKAKTEFLFVLIAYVTAYKPNAAENDLIEVRFFQLLSTLTVN